MAVLNKVLYSLQVKTDVEAQITVAVDEGTPAAELTALVSNIPASVTEVKSIQRIAVCYVVHNG